MDKTVEVSCGEEDAASGVLGDGAPMEAQAAAVWHVAYLGHIAVEAGRPREAQGIVARGDEVAAVFEGMERGLDGAEMGDHFAFSVDGLAALRFMSEESNLHRANLIKNYELRIITYYLLPITYCLAK